MAPAGQFAREIACDAATSSWSPEGEGAAVLRRGGAGAWGVSAAMDAMVAGDEVSWAPGEGVGAHAREPTDMGMGGGTGESADTARGAAAPLGHDGVA